jgi:hypothetical protein
MNRVKKPLKIALMVIIAAALFASCASKPKPIAPEPAPAPVAQPAPEPAPVVEAAPVISQDELDALLAEAKALKKKAFDFKLFEVLPDDYKASDALYQKGLASYNAKDAPAAKDGLNAAIASYKDLLDRGIQLVAAAKRKEAEDMKATAIKAGADYSQAERFGAGDEVFDSAAALVDEGKAEEAVPTYEKSRLYYELAFKRAVASQLKLTIDDKGYAKWDSGNFQLAETKFAAEEGFWASEKEEDRTAGVDGLDEAILRYNLVVQKGREMAVAVVKEKTDASRQRAEAIKANVAVKDMFESAMGMYGEGGSQLAAKEYESAADAYGRSGSAFDDAYAAAAEKRAKATEAMKAAEEATAESQRKASEADPLIEPVNP